jgi:hypothetical protein
MSYPYFLLHAQQSRHLWCHPNNICSELQTMRFIVMQLSSSSSLDVLSISSLSTCSMFRHSDSFTFNNKDNKNQQHCLEYTLCIPILSKGLYLFVSSFIYPCHSIFLHNSTSILGHGSGNNSPSDPFRNHSNWLFTNPPTIRRHRPTVWNDSVAIQT